MNHSLYVRLLPTDMGLNGKRLFDKKSIKRLFHDMNWGEVSRVDYFQKSAFIQFEEIYPIGFDNINLLSDVKKIKIYGYTDLDGTYHSIYSLKNPRLNRFIEVRINKPRPKNLTCQVIPTNKTEERKIGCPMCGGYTPEGEKPVLCWGHYHG